MNFECPRCGSHRIEEILIDVVQATEVTEVKDEDGFAVLDYGDHTLDGGEVQGFQCLRCGEHIAKDQEELLRYLKERNML